MGALAARLVGGLVVLAIAAAAGAWSAGKWIYRPQITAAEALAGRANLERDACHATTRHAKTIAEAQAGRAQARIDSLSRDLRTAKRRAAVSASRVCLTADELRVIRDAVTAAAGDHRADESADSGGTAAPAGADGLAPWW